ncbi:MAG TPA: hypothetical protein VI547_07225 [Anaerolineales bacterium]|nr:hypothetical protein [Anaerolineales bacterium]HLF01752.1 hypothetical protein [Anaerolineales bacterium]
MKLKLNIFLLIASVLGLAFGAPFVMAPELLLSFYGVTVEEGGIVVAQLFGASLIEVGLILILARNVTAPDTQQAITLGGFVGTAIGFVVALMGQLAGRANALGWSTVVIYLALAVGFGYFRFMKPAA